MAVKALSAIAFFPTEPMAQAIVGDALAAMCPSVAALRHAVRRACGLYKTWEKCGIQGLRQIVCASYQPADGIAAGPTEMYPEGLPSETRCDPLALPAGEVKRLAAGEKSQVSHDARLSMAVNIAAESVKLRSATLQRPVTKAELDACPEWLKRLEGYES